MVLAMRDILGNSRRVAAVFVHEMGECVMEGSAFAFGIVIGVLAMVLTVAVLTDDNMRHDAMKEAFERGHAVQCLGKSGYYWECE
jgi:hypothetical protein